jgi:hypothetical protein
VLPTPEHRYQSYKQNTSASSPRRTGGVKVDRRGRLFFQGCTVWSNRKAEVAGPTGPFFRSVTLMTSAIGEVDDR